MAKEKSLNFEALEDRCVPATFGLPWADHDLTVSFAPDGTSVNSQASNAFASLSAAYGSDAWKREVLRALQTWASAAGINIGLTADLGLAFGTPGAGQGDKRFGDIRIGGAGLGTDVGAIATPPDYAAGTWAGDILVNTDQTFVPGGKGFGSGLDLFTVLLHEAGHTFGLAENPDPNSAMSDYFGPKTGLSAADIAAIRALYGTRPADQNEGAWGNDVRSRATGMSDLATLLSNDRTYGVAGDVTTNGDVDYFRFTAVGGQATINLRAQGYSLLLGRVTVEDSNGNVLATREATDVLSNDVSLSLSGLVTGRSYFIRVASATKDVFGVGGYALTVHSATSIVGEAGVNVRNLVSDLTENVGGVSLNTTLLPFLLVNKLTPDGAYAIPDGSGVSQYYHSALTLPSSLSVGTFQVQAMAGQAGQTLVVDVHSTDGTATPKVTVYDSLHRQVAAEVLVNQGGSMTLRIADVTAGAKYFVCVQAEGQGLLLDAAQFAVAATFTTADVTSLQTYGTGALDAAHATASQTVTASESQTVHLALSAKNLGGGANDMVTMTIRDAAGKVVFTLTAKAGQTQTGDVTLAAGTYTISYQATGAKGGAPAGKVGFQLAGWDVTDPIGPRPANTGGGGSGNTGSGSTGTSSTLKWSSTTSA